MGIREQFNRISKEYDAKRRLFIPCHDEFYQETTAFIASCIRKPKTVLDLGAGTGLLTSFWYRHFPESGYILMDEAEEMLGIARRRFAGCGNVVFETGNYADHLPANDFDAVISALSIHHLEDEAKSLLFRNLRNRLPAGGLFVNYDQFCASDERMNDWFSCYWEDGLARSGLNGDDLALWRDRQKLDRECSVSAEIRMLREAGFSSVECVFSRQKFAVVAAIK